MEFELIKDFQYTNSEMQIMTLPKGTVLKKSGEYFSFFIRKKEYKIDKRVVENNPDHFKKIDILTQLQDIIKKNKSSNSPKLAKLIFDFLQKQVLSESELVDYDTVEIMLNACRLQYKTTHDEKWLIPFEKVEWDADSDGVYKRL